jgi:hypothetical protein
VCFGAGAALRHRPPGAYASISLIDIPYLGFDRAHLARLDDPVARRARKATAALARARGRLTTASTLDLLRRVKQPITRWSAAYDLRARTVHVVMGQKYGGRALTFGVT